MISNKEQDKIIKQLKCLDGEQFDTNENRCLPCSHYNLVWDPKQNICKPMLKEEILKEQEKSILSKGMELSPLKLLTDSKNNIIGYME